MKIKEIRKLDASPFKTPQGGCAGGVPEGADKPPC